MRALSGPPLFLLTSHVCGHAQCRVCVCQCVGTRAVSCVRVFVSSLVVTSLVARLVGGAVCGLGVWDHARSARLRRTTGRKSKRKRCTVVRIDEIIEIFRFDAARRQAKTEEREKMRSCVNFIDHFDPLYMRCYTYPHTECTRKNEEACELITDPPSICYT